MALKQYFANIFYTIYSLYKGFCVTFGKLMHPNITVEYPFENKTYSGTTSEGPFEDLKFEGFRGKLVNYTADCISCDKCAVVCPVDCITLTSSKREDFDPEIHTASTGHPLRLKLETYDIDMNKCMYCALCTEVCPTDCLVMTDDVEYSSDDRDDMTIAFTDESATGYGRQ